MTVPGCGCSWRARSMGATVAVVQPRSPGRDTTGAVCTWDTTGGARARSAGGPHGSAVPGTVPATLHAQQ